MTRWKLASATLAATVSMMALAVMTLAAGDDARLKTAVRFVDDYQTPGLESELSGIFPHPTNDDHYFVLANMKPPYRLGHTPMLPATYRGQLLTVDRSGRIVHAVKVAEDDFGGLTFVDGFAYVALTNDSSIIKINPATGERLARFPLPSPAGGLDYDRDRGALIAQLYVGHPHLALLDVKTGKVIGTRWSDESAMGLVKVDGDWLCTWTSGWDPGSFSELRVIDQDTGRVHSRMRLDHVHSVLAPAHTHSGQPAFLSLVTLDSVTGRTVIKRYAYDGDRH